MNAASSDSARNPAGWVIRRPATAASERDADVRIWGLAPEERLLRSLRRAGCSDPRVVDADAPPSAAGPVVAVRADVVLDERLVAGLRASPDTWLATPELGPVGAHVAAEDVAAMCRALGSGNAEPLAALRRAAPGELASAYVAKLRKREPPYVFAVTREDAERVEHLTFRAAYKGLTDLVTKWVWPVPAAAVTRWCAQRGVRPNTVTLWSWALAGLAALLFARGEFAAGLACAWVMTFLDTVDGKLARVTLTSSPLGSALDHGLDLIHPPLWWWAWGVGLGAGHELATAIVIVGYVAGRALEGAFLSRFGFETHSWRPIDGLFRTVTARRNPNLILVTVGTLDGRPDLGLVMVALWTLVSLAFHGVRLVQALRQGARGAPPAPWEDA